MLYGCAGWHRRWAKLKQPTQTAGSLKLSSDEIELDVKGLPDMVLEPTSATGTWGLLIPRSLWWYGLNGLFIGQVENWIDLDIKREVSKC